MNTSVPLTRRLTNTVGLIQRLILPFERPWFALLFSLVFFMLLTSVRGVPWRATSRAYYNYQADAWLHGQIGLRVLPEDTQDLTLYQGQYYLYWGPLPSLLMLPAVAVFGLNASDVLQSILFGSVNAALLALLLRRVSQRGMISLEPWQRGLMVLFFTLGTPHTTLTPVGKVWFTGQVIAFTCILLAYLAAFSLEDGPAFFWTGCAVAAIFLTRQSAVLSALFLVWYLLRRHWAFRWKRLLGYCLLALLPVIIAFLFQGWYNFIRFGNPLETGTTHQLMYEGFRPEFDRYGLFNVYYFPINLYYNYLYHPFVGWLQSGEIELLGGGIFLLSPLLFAAFTTLWQDRRGLDHWMLWATFLIGNIPAMFLLGPTLQFGVRYSLDFILPLYLLTAMGMRRWPAWLVLLLTYISIFMFVFGALLFLFIKTL